MIVQKFQTIEFQISKFYNLLQKSKTHFLTFFQNNLSILTNLCNQKNFIRKTKYIPNFFTIPSLIINPNSPFQLIIRQNQSSKSSKSKNQNPERDLPRNLFESSQLNQMILRCHDVKSPRNLRGEKKNNKKNSSQSRNTFEANPRSRSIDRRKEEATLVSTALPRLIQEPSVK